MSAAVAPDADQIMLGECLELLPGLPEGFFQLIYLDPPFNTGRRRCAGRCGRSRTRGRPARASAGAPTAPSCSPESSYRDQFDDYLGFLGAAPARRRAGC